MKSFYFDLIALPRSWFWARGVLLLAGLCAGVGVLTYERMVLSPELEAQRQLIQDQRAKMGSREAPSSMKPTELAQAWRNAQGAASQLNLPWSRFFAVLGESSVSADVALISIEPDTQKGQAILIAEARNPDSMLNFVSALQHSDEFSEVALQSHLINRNVPENPIRFRISTRWRIKP